MNYLILLLVLLIPVDVFAAVCGTKTGTTYNCTTITPAAITDTIAAATAGDTILFPASGSATWTSGVTVNKALTINGNGSTLTIGASFSTGVFNFTASTTSLVKVVGFTINLGSYSTPAFYLNGDMTQLAIGNNSITAGASYHTYQAGGRAYGVIYNNTFKNSKITFDLTGNNNTSWAETITAGSGNSDTLYIEGNSFIRDNSLACADNLQNHLESSQGARYVARYNTFDGTAWCGGTYNHIDPHIMPHGDNPNDGTTRGSPILEYYNNYSTTVRAYYWVMRGGSIVAHDNIIKGSYLPDGNNIFGLREEDCESGYKNWSTWPAKDQIFNSFFWNNYTNDAKTQTAVPFLWPGTSSSVVVVNKDYFLHAPQSSGGAETLYNSGTSSYTYVDASHKMTWDGGVANAYYPYTPYTCPHPLAGSGSCDSTKYGTTGYTVTSTPVTPVTPPGAVGASTTGGVRIQ